MYKLASVCVLCIYVCVNCVSVCVVHLCVYVLYICVYAVHICVLCICVHGCCTVSLGVKSLRIEVRNLIKCLLRPGWLAYVNLLTCVVFLLRCLFIASSCVPVVPVVDNSRELDELKNMLQSSMEARDRAETEKSVSMSNVYIRTFLKAMYSTFEYWLT